MQKDLTKITNSLLRRPLKFSDFACLNFGAAAAWNCGMRYFGIR